jgi:hypothetical protein
MLSHNLVRKAAAPFLSIKNIYLQACAVFTVHGSAQTKQHQFFLIACNIKTKIWFVSLSLLGEIFGYN